MIYKARLPLLLIFALVLSTYNLHQNQLKAQSTSEWVQRSNQYSKLLLDVQAKYYPESAGRLGIDGYDEEILDLTPGFTDRYIQDLEVVKIKIQSKLSQEAGPVKQDLQILLMSIDNEIEELRLDKKYLLPYYNIAEVIYFGIRSLLEDRIPPERRQAALVRLQKYVGTGNAGKPLTHLAQEYQKDEWKSSNRLPPFIEDVERNLNTSSQYIEEIDTLFKRYEIEGFEEDYQKLIEQIDIYNNYVKEEILLKARKDFKLPHEIYAFKLKEYGIDMPVDELKRRASVAFKELQAQMQVLAVQIAEKHGFPSNDYRNVIHYLKEEQLDSAAILPFYRQQIKEIEEIIRREEIVTLPERSMTIRLATRAESAASPSPHMNPPRLIGNTGEYGEFVLPVRVPSSSNGSSLLIDDFTHKAASWPLTVHEGRPGHELQFTSIVERGVSQARIIFAFNSVNAEGWAMYMEEHMLPYLPLEGQFMTLWSRLVRAGRAFLDPGLNLGTISTDEARHVLQDEIIISEALVNSELERYRFRAPGQATSYFNGYLRLMELRAETELLLGDQFNQREFHDFILSQGLLPPELVRQATLNEFVPSQSD
jgi:hypothetical protein